MRRTKRTIGPRNRRLRASAGRALRPAANEQGYVLLWAIFGFVLVGGLLAATLSTAASERRAAGANAQWKASFYAAEAGLREVLGFANDTLVGGLDPGQSMELAWRPVTTSADYRAVIYRVDGGAGQKLYLLNVTGRSGGAFTGYSAQNLMFTIDAGPPAAAIVANGPLVISGDPELTGACADVTANGSISIGGTLTTEGRVSSAGYVDVSGGAIVNWEGMTVTPEENADPVSIPAMAAADFCADADVTLRNGYVIDAAGDSVTAESSTAWKWDDNKDLYEPDKDELTAGTVCAFGNLKVSEDLGTPASPLSLSLITSGSLDMHGKVFMVADDPSGLVVLTEGDMKLHAYPEVGGTNFAGFIYAGSQCEIDNDSVVQGQLVCRDDPDPAGAQNLLDVSDLSGDLVLTGSCVVGGGGNAVPIVSRAWSPVF